MKKIFKKLKLNNLFIAISSAIIFLIGFLIFYKFKMRYDSNDDFELCIFIVEGYDCMYISRILAMIIIPLQKVFSNINILVLSQLILNFISMIVIDFVIISRLKNKYGMLLLCTVNSVISYFCFICFQYTITTTNIGVAGYLLLFYSLYDVVKDKKNISVASILTGTILVIISSLYRWYSFVSVSVVFVAFSVCILFIDVIKKKNKLKSYINIRSFLCLAIVFVSALGVHFISEFIRQSDSEYIHHKDYQTARSLSIDYEIAPYEGNEEFYNSIDIYSPNDLYIWRYWTADYTFFNLDRLNAINDYSQEYSDFFHNSKELIFNVNFKLQEKLNNLYYPAMTAVFIIGCCSLMFTIIFRNKLRFIFPVIITFIWLVYFYLFGFCGDLNNVYVALMPAIFIVITSFLCNRYYFISVSAITCIIFAITTYLQLTRINLRANYTVILSLMCIVFCNFNKEYLRASVRKIKINVKIENVVYSIVSISVVISCFMINTKFHLVPYEYYYMPVIMNYMENTADNFYLMERFIGSKNYSYPLLAPKISDNSVSASWSMGSGFSVNTMKKYGIENLYPDLIDNEKAFYVCHGDRQNYIDSLEVYYNEHYSDSKNNIKIIPAYVLENCFFYSVVTS